MYDINSENFNIGDIVQIEVRTGTYVGEIVEQFSPRYVVKILAVLKHPDQGDLHQPYDPDVPLFHERRALSFSEKTNVLPRQMKHYNGNIPSYKDSLIEAVEQKMKELDRVRRYSDQSLQLLKELKDSY